MGQPVQQDREAHELNKKANKIMEVFPIFDQKVINLTKDFLMGLWVVMLLYFKGMGLQIHLQRRDYFIGQNQTFRSRHCWNSNAAPTLNKVVKKKKQQMYQKVAASQSHTSNEGIYSK